LEHIKAHTGLNDEHSQGNAEADRLANLAVGVVVCVATDCLDNTLISNIKEPIKYDKHYINIEFDYKDSVKKLGAKWDMSCKKWYYEDNISETNKKAIEDIVKMSESNMENEEKITVASDNGVDNEINKKIYVKIPFKNKDAVKKLGCRWEPEKKSWYYMSNLEKNKIDSIKKLEA
jgi:hypothetical protein